MGLLTNTVNIVINNNTYNLLFGDYDNLPEE